MRARATILGAAAILFAAKASAAPLDVVPFATLDVPRFTSSTLGFSELDAGPGAVRDGDPTTAWVVPGDPDATSTLLLDWSGWGATPFVVTELRIDVDPPSAALAIDAGTDLASIAPAAVSIARDATGATVAFTSGAPLRLLRIGLPGGAKVASIHATATPGGALAGTPTATCDADGVHLTVPTTGALALAVSRVGSPFGITRRRFGTITDATVRFDARPATYSYAIAPVGADTAATVSVTCDGAAMTRLPADAIHGTVEGFYGRPWTWHERAKVVASMGALGLDTFVYAPKDDPYHRDKWREPYPADAMARFKDLAALGRGLGVNVVYAISPGQDIDPNKASDVDALLAKIDAMAGVGLRDAALLMDDLDAATHPHDAALGHAHAALATALLASMRRRDPAARLWFVPTVYSGLVPSLPAGDAAYVSALSALPSGVPIAWTGNGVFSSSLALADGVAFVALAGRGAKDLWVWDNYPANDVAVFRSLYGRPIVGRDSLLPDGGGLLANPMRHALASLPAIASYAELAADPAAYATARRSGAPIANAARALALADADAPPRALADFFAELVHHDTIWPNDFASPELTRAIATYLARPTGGAMRDAALDLVTRLGRLAVADVDLRRDLDDTALSDEIDAHARTTSAIARAVLAAVSADRAERLGDAAAATSLRQRAACDWLLVNQPTWWTIQKAVEALVPKIDTSSCADTGDPLAGPASRDALVGRPIALSFADAQEEPSAAWSLVGPEGATVGDDGVVAWTPSRLGRYRFVAIRAGASGAAAKAFDVVVVERRPSAAVDAGGCGCASTPNHGGAAPIVVGILVLALRLRGRRALTGCA